MFSIEVRPETPLPPFALINHVRETLPRDFGEQEIRDQSDCLHIYFKSQCQANKATKRLNMTLVSQATIFAYPFNLASRYEKYISRNEEYLTRLSRRNGALRKELCEEDREYQKTRNERKLKLTTRLLVRDYDGEKNTLKRQIKEINHKLQVLKSGSKGQLRPPLRRPFKGYL